MWFSAAFIVGIPFSQLLIFGYAIDQDVRQIPTAIVDADHSNVSRRLLGQLEATQTFDLIARASDEQSARRLLETGDVQSVISIPADYARRYYRGSGVEVSVWVDATDPTVARGSELMTGKILPYVAIGFLQIGIILASGIVFFDLPIRGSLLDLLIASVLFIAANLARRAAPSHPLRPDHEGGSPPRRRPGEPVAGARRSRSLLLAGFVTATIVFRKELG